MFETWRTLGPRPTSTQPVRKVLLHELLGSRSENTRRTSARCPEAAIFIRPILEGSRLAVPEIWPRIPIVVTLGLAFRPKQMATEIALVPAVSEATQATLLILPTVLLSGVTISPRRALVSVLKQSASITTAGGVTLGHRLMGSANNLTTLIMITATDTIVDRIGCLTKACKPTTPPPATCPTSGHQKLVHPDGWSR